MPNKTRLVLLIHGAWPLVAAFFLVFTRLAYGLEVNLTENLPYVDIVYEGKTVRIQRIQDTNHRLINNFAKTSRPCPPFCIHPMKASIGVETVGELELLDFLMTKVTNDKGLLIDARLPEWYRKGTIPGRGKYTIHGADGWFVQPPYGGSLKGARILEW